MPAGRGAAVASLQAPVKTLLICNYDSYTYNLYQLLAMVNGEEPTVVRNDVFGENWEDYVHRLAPFDNVVLSPGPGHPGKDGDFGVCSDALRRYKGPLLGVCLGHQGMAHVHGADVVHAPQVMHGQLSDLWHDGRGLFRGIRQGAPVVRYHSLAVDMDTLDTSLLRPTAFTSDGVLMGLQHASLPHHGVQFHPESVGTELGRRLLENFRDDTIAFYEGDASPSSAAVLGVAPGRRADFKAEAEAPGDIAGDMAGETEKEKGKEKETEAAAAAAFEGVAEWEALRIELPEGSHVPMESLFAALFAEDDAAFWLDSSNVAKREDAGAGNPQNARFSYMGTCDGPAAHALLYRGPGAMSVVLPDGTALPQDCNIFDFLRRETERFAVAGVAVGDAAGGAAAAATVAASALEDPFLGGYVGYLGYELRHDVAINRAAGSGPPSPSDFAGDPDVPDALFLFADRFVSYDHQANTTALVHLFPRGDAAAREAAERWAAEMASEVERLAAAESGADAAGGGGALEFSPRKGREKYMEEIAKCRSAIVDGESYEICLTTQLECSADIDPLHFYRKLRRGNGAPYGAFLKYDPSRRLGGGAGSGGGGGGGALASLAVCCSSPERFLRVRGRVAESKPIKGTVKRDRADASRDRRLALELSRCPKNRGENLMIVDLVRNDLGRVCDVGSVSVPKLMAVESYETVHQLVSTVVGDLREGCGAVDAVEACYPGGSMTGAPKLRTLDLIHELEDGRPRGVYSGALGYFSVNGNADLNIVIRTAVITPGKASLGAGGAITFLSDSSDEFDEMLLKARSVVAAVGATITEGGGGGADGAAGDAAIEAGGAMPSAPLLEQRNGTAVMAGP